MTNLLKVVLGRKLPQKKLDEIKKKRDFKEKSESIIPSTETSYLLTSNEITITEEKTRLLNRKKGIQRYTTETKKYTLDGFLLSSETLVWSKAPGDLFPVYKDKEHKKVKYDPAGRFFGKAIDD